MTLHLGVLIWHHRKVLGKFTESWSAEKYLVLHSHPFFCVTTCGHGLWTVYERKVSCMGCRNLYIGSFKEMNKRSAKGKARGWQRYLWSGGSSLEVQLYMNFKIGCVKHDGNTHWCPAWHRFLLQHKGGPAVHSTKYLMSSFVLPFPTTAHCSHSLPLRLPFFWLLSTRFINPLKHVVSRCKLQVPRR